VAIDAVQTTRHVADGTDDAVIDSHVHVWDADRVHYAWLAEVPQLARRVDLEQVEPDLRAAGVEQVVLIQAADNIDDTELMLATARRNSCVSGVVAWVPLLDVDRAAALLNRWAAEPIVGVRHLVHRDPDPDLLADHRIDAVLRLLSERGLSFDVCAETEHLLELVPRLAYRHPHLQLIIDHLAKPPIASRRWDPWARLLTQAAQSPNVVVKLSGLNTAAGIGDSSSAYQPYVDHALDVFGPERVMYGGDWPFALLAAESYSEIWSGLRRCLDGLDRAARQAVLSGTARRVYRRADGAGR
jgi:L-fuconolactonase